MKCRLWIVACLMALGITGMVAGQTPPSHDDSFSKEGLFKANAAELKDTKLVATTDVPLEPGQNVLWCGTLQLAWNKAIELVGEKLRFEKSSPVADALNREDFTEADLSPDCYVAIADFERNNVEDEIRAALEKAFHGAASPELIPPKPRDPGPDDFVAYAYLYKNLAFTQPFFSLESPLSFQNEKVQSFGFKADQHVSKAVLDQISIYDYKSPDDFIISLKTESPDDELILAKIPPATTLQATVADVLERIKKNEPATANSDDPVAIPKLNFDLRRNFSELEGLVLDPSPTAHIKNKLVVTEVQQLVRFQLNQKGAVLKSEAVIVMRALAILRPSHPLIFDHPFLILMKEKKSSQPYFALWVGNASLLVPATKP